MVSTPRQTWFTTSWSLFLCAEPTNRLMKSTLTAIPNWNRLALWSSALLSSQPRLTIFWRAVNSLFDYFTSSASPAEISPLTLYIALFTVGLKIFLSIYTKKVGQRTKNPSIIALAQDHRNDIFSASAVVIGVILGRMGILWMDAFAGALVAVFIARTGFSILQQSTDDLMDTVPGKALRQQIEQVLVEVPGIQEIDSMQAHRFGQYLVINLAIFVDGALSVDEGDAIADEVERKITESVDYVRAVHVHFHSHK